MTAAKSDFLPGRGPSQFDLPSINCVNFVVDLGNRGGLMSYRMTPRYDESQPPGLAICAYFLFFPDVPAGDHVGGLFHVPG